MTSTAMDKRRMTAHGPLGDSRTTREIETTFCELALLLGVARAETLLGELRARAGAVIGEVAAATREPTTTGEVIALPVPPRTREERERAVVAEYRRHPDVAFVATRAGVGVATVYRYLHKHGLIASR
jgi:hypothetical protein